MNIKDAANILNLSGEVDKDDIKKAYRSMAQKFHPDKNPAGAEMMQVLNAAYTVLKDWSGVVEDHGASKEQHAYTANLSSAIEVVLSLDGLIIEICGGWLWVSGETKTHKTILKENGFFYASKKKSWYFRPSDWKSSSRGAFSMDDIRDKYGAQTPVAGANKKRALTGHA